MTPTLPTIHMNGTSAETLLEDNCNCARAVNEALDVIQKAEFNGRDYYPVPGSWEKALAERTAHMKALKAAAEYFFAIAEHCSDAVAAKEARQNASNWRNPQPGTVDHALKYGLGEGEDQPH